MQKTNDLNLELELEQQAERTKLSWKDRITDLEKRRSWICEKLSEEKEDSELRKLYESMEKETDEKIEKTKESLEKFEKEYEKLKMEREEKMVKLELEMKASDERIRKIKKKLSILLSTSKQSFWKSYFFVFLPTYSAGLLLGLWMK